LSSDFS
jgi:hypothetical protein